MSVLVAGATGATGRLLVEQLLAKGEQPRIIVRSPDTLPPSLIGNPDVSVTSASILDLNEKEMIRHVDGCDALACCLGHTLSFRGIYGNPRRLVIEAIERLCQAVRTVKPDNPVRLVLMNTAGNSNRDLDEPITFSHNCVIRLLRLLLPPHKDNEMAADYLRTRIGQNDPLIEWVVVRPDTLINENLVSEYDLYPSPTRSAIFDPGKTSRINVANFMAELVTDEALWQKWKGQMPVIYNRANPKE